MIRCKVNLLDKLKEAGYSTGRIRSEKIMGQQMLQNIRQGALPSWAVLDKICKLTGSQPGDLVEYIDE